MPTIRRYSTEDADFPAQLRALTALEATQDEAVETAVAAIVTDVRRRGDAAVLDYTRRFDRLAAVTLQELKVESTALRSAYDDLPAALRDALNQAAARIRAYHARQLAQSWHYREPDGTLLGQQITPLDRVGIYVPGGQAAYPSSLLMNAIPARVAGVQDIVAVVPTPDGVRNPMVLAAACVAGIDCVYTLGGAQAIAALAYGTQSIAPVDKIVGPGNAYVAAAKRRVFGIVGIDMVAGPSEVLVICDGSVPADWIAMDLFAQAEHDALAQALLLSPDAEFIDVVARAIERLLPSLPRADTIRQSLRARGAFIKVRDVAEACALANEIAPEHLELAVRDPETWLPKIRHAGAIFLGGYSSEALGDYCAGPNHVLPTSRSARFSSPLGVYDFQKRSSVIQVSAAGSVSLGRIASVLAHGEGFQAHARAAELRLEAVSGGAPSAADAA
jgi:histidinol dehydrogenase